MKRAVRAIRPHLVATAAFSAALNLLFLAPTLYMLQIYDRVVVSRGIMTLLLLTLLLIAALLALSLFELLRRRLMVRAAAAFDNVLASTLLPCILKGSETLRTRQILREFDQLRGTLTGNAMVALFDAPWIPLYIAVGALLHPLIGWFLFCGTVLLVIMGWLGARKLRPHVADAKLSAERCYQEQDDLLSAIETVRGLGMRASLANRLHKAREHMLSEQVAASLISSGSAASGKFVRLSLQSLALGIAAYLFIGGEVGPGVIFAASLLVSRCLQPIDQLIAAASSLFAAPQQFATIDDMLLSAEEVLPKLQLPMPTGKIDVEELTIYNTAMQRPLLKQISFTVAPGEVVALLGSSGAGKSTLLRAMAGAIPHHEGEIRFDGAVIGDWEPDRLATGIGYLPQDSRLIAGSVAENIARFTDEIADLETSQRILDAASKAGAVEMINRLSGGFGTMLGIGGTGISAGQRQQIALARALYGEPRILLLDEPNASLDREGDKALFAAIAAAKEAGASVIVACHKLGLMPLVDRLIVMQDGEVDLIGHPDEVLQKMLRQGVRAVVNDRSPN